MAGIGQDLKKIYSDETRIVENASLCTVWDRVPKEDAANFESDTFL